jgi:hypothetical protein
MLNGVGEVAKTVASSLGGAPVLLFVVVLNVLMVSGATYFLSKQEQYRHLERMQVMGLFADCIGARFHAPRQPPPERSEIPAN